MGNRYTGALGARSIQSPSGRARLVGPASVRPPHVERNETGDGRLQPEPSCVTRDALTGWTQAPGTGTLAGVDESQQWVEFGRWLAEQREERGLRRRDAARRAKVSESLWRDLETGRKEGRH